MLPLLSGPVDRHCLNVGVDDPNGTARPQVERDFRGDVFVRVGRRENFDREKRRTLVDSRVVSRLRDKLLRNVSHIDSDD